MKRGIIMCTIGAVKLEHTYIFKNRDPIRGTPIEEWIETINFKSKRFLVIKNHQGCYGALNQEGVGAVGTFVNMIAEQNNYFNGNNLLEILHKGSINYIREYLQYNPQKYYGNIICSDGISIYAFELNGNEVNCLSVLDRYVMTNHFQQIKEVIRTISDTYIKTWTEKRLLRSQNLIETVLSCNDIKKLLSDHDGYPDFSICNHGRIHTGASYIIDCSDKYILYCVGHPCQNEYIEYNFLI